MRINAICILMLACCAPAISQLSKEGTDLPNPSETLKKGIARNNNYLWSLLELQGRETEYLASPLKGLYLDYMSYITSWVGDHEAAYLYEERFLESLEPRIQRRKAHAPERKAPLSTEVRVSMFSS